MSTHDAIPQDLALRLQMAAIASAEPSGSFFECRYKRTDGRGMGQVFHPADKPREFVETVQRFGATTDTYLGCALRCARSGGADRVGSVNVLWADLDTASSIEALDGFLPRPSLVILSGSGEGEQAHRHAYWPLRDSLKGEHAVIANRRLAHALGADMASTDVARILRPAGTLNFKHDPPREVRCVRLELDVHRARDVVGHLPDPPRAPARRSTEPRQIPAGEDPLLSISALEYVPALATRELSRDGKVQCPWHAGGAERTPSLHAYPGDRGWYCWGCDAGGTIIDFGAQLYGLSPRGRDYHEIRRRLAADLLPHVRHAAA